jgi:serine/threonine protein kinase
MFEISKEEFIDEQLNIIQKKEIEALNILSKIENPYLLKFIGKGIGNSFLNNLKSDYMNKPYIIFEYPSDLIADLYDLFIVEKKGFSEVEAKFIFRQILLGVNEMHKHNICHRNLALNSIFLDENYNIKIFDYDFCCINKEDLKEIVGTRKYIAPEINNNERYNGIKCDIFSLGQILFVIRLGIFGFESSNRNDKNYKFISEKKYELFWKIIKEFVDFAPSNSFKDLFLRMVAYIPEERPSINKILADEWFKDINNLSNEEMMSLENKIKKEFKYRVEEKEKN